MKRCLTANGFQYVMFNDDFGVECSIQMSTPSDGECIWLGCSNPEPKFLDETDGKKVWSKIELPDGAIFNARMHLSRKHAAELIPMLQKFVDTGYIY